ncbi:short chain dehydrogenase [Delphinella strobiligena]|nr:short chain dehydrogenase [Delphinella strobiligena]
MSELTITDADLRGLNDKVIIITGGSSGIGLETAKKFLGLGAKVVNGDLNPPPSDIAHEKLSYVPVDVTSWEQLSALFEKTVELYGRIDHVFANAGVGPKADYLEARFSEDGKLLEPSHVTLDINLKSVINTTYLAIHYMKKQKSIGSVVITASATAIQPLRYADYTSSKHGCLGFMRGMVPITFPHIPVRINLVAPEWTATTLVDPTFIEQIEKSGGVWQEPEVVSRSVGLLMADEARHGQMIYSAQGKFQETESLLLSVSEKIRGTCPPLEDIFLEH